MSGIVLPPKLYIDTAHLANISKTRSNRKLPCERFENAYKFIDECIRFKNFGLIVSVGAFLEWGDGAADASSVRELAEVVDSAKLFYVYEGDTLTWTKEILAECARIRPELRVPKLPPPLQAVTESGHFLSTVGIISNQVPDYVERSSLLPHLQNLRSFPETIPWVRAHDAGQRALSFHRDNPELCAEHIAGYAAAMGSDLEGWKRKERITGESVLQWMKRSLKIDVILSHLNPGCDVDRVLAEIDRTRCPAVQLWLRAREFRLRAGHDPKPNEVDDWMILPVVPYSDLVLTDTGIAEFLLQADRQLSSRVFCSPEKAAEALKS